MLKSGWGAAKMEKSIGVSDIPTRGSARNLFEVIPVELKCREFLSMGVVKI